MGIRIKKAPFTDYIPQLRSHLLCIRASHPSRQKIKNHLYFCVWITQLKALKTRPPRHVGDNNTRYELYSFRSLQISNTIN